MTLYVLTYSCKSLIQNGWGMAECPKFRNEYMILEILIFFFFLENEWGMAECPYFLNWRMTFENLDIWGKDDFFLFFF